MLYYQVLERRQPWMHSDQHTCSSLVATIIKLTETATYIPFVKLFLCPILSPQCLHYMDVGAVFIG